MSGSGSGNGSVSFKSAANGASQRVGTLTVAGTPVTVTQNAALPPMISDTFNVTIAEDSGTGAITFTVADPDNSTTGLTVTADDSDDKAEMLLCCPSLCGPAP
jgi:hypothetical protein